jgi:hypothetical protein
MSNISLEDDGKSKVRTSATPPILPGSSTVVSGEHPMHKPWLLVQIQPRETFSPHNHRELV